MPPPARSADATCGPSSLPRGSKCGHAQIGVWPKRRPSPTRTATRSSPPANVPGWPGESPGSGPSESSKAEDRDRTEVLAMIEFADRVEAGRMLAEWLEHLRGQDVVVLGLPRGGVPVAFEVAQALNAPLDVIVVRKLGVPVQPELAMGAIGEGGARVLEAEVLRQTHVTEEQLRAVETRERGLLEARVARLRRGRERLNLDGRIAVIVDDGIATGSTARVACGVARHLGAAKVVLAVPVAPAETVRDLAEADEVVFVSVPRRFMAVGYHYRDFSPTSDEEGIVLLDVAAGRVRGGR